MVADEGNHDLSVCAEQAGGCCQLDRHSGRVYRSKQPQAFSA